MQDFAFMDATAQAELVRKGEVSPVELVLTAIERIERINPQLNAVIETLYLDARAQASSELPEGPFRGVPFLVKDLLAECSGVKLRSGCRLLSDYVSAVDSELVTRQRKAGLIILGKTNTPEFGILPTTEPQLFGATRNPWDVERTPGGSSGGSAAAVASGMVPMAHGNDGGGSIRIPASCCGLFGLKPTRGRNPLGPIFGDIISGLVCEHALTRSVRDSAALLDATSGPAVGDPYWAPPPTRPFSEEVGAEPGRLRIAFVSAAPTDAPIHPDCIQAVRDAASLCSELGHEVEEITLEVDGAALTQAFVTLWASGVAWNLELAGMVAGKPATPDQFEPLTWTLAEMGRSMNAGQYLAAVTQMQMLTRHLAETLQPYDAVLTSTLNEPPPLLGSFDAVPGNPLAGLMRSASFMPFTPVCNAGGMPAMNVPLYWNQEGLPIGTQFIGRFGDEATLFRLAAQLEQARPWAQRRPPVSA
ncbi:MAG: amidase [Candidatus Geothermincolia bacterium]